MFEIPRLDIMVAYSCNIRCQGCISISDIKRSGIEPFESLVGMIHKWSSVLAPKTIAIFGGEPCLHPRLQDLCAEIRMAWPNTTIRLITNGYLLDNFDSSAWFDFAPFEIQVSVHRKDHESVINQQIKRIMVHRRPWAVIRHGAIDQHKQMSWSHKDFSIYKSIFAEFITPYKKVNDEFMPWHSDAADAHKICGSPATPILYKGLLYKCPPVANIMDITDSNWFGYQAIDVTDNIDEFIKRIGQPETVCAQCPDQSQAVAIDHFNKENVIVKHKNFN